MTCQHCGQPLPPKRENEAPSRYAARKYCSKSCANRSIMERRKAERVVPTCSHPEGCDRDVVAKGLCQKHYWREKHGKRHKRVVDMTPKTPPPAHPPVKCVICEAVRILARDGADARQTAAALHKPVPWIQTHLSTCTREKRTA